MQNHLLALLVLTFGLIAFAKRPSLGLLGVITGGLWNLIDYVPDRAITDPYTLGNIAFNIPDILIAVGFVITAAEFFRKIEQ